MRKYDDAPGDRSDNRAAVESVAPPYPHPPMYQCDKPTDILQQVQAIPLFKEVDEVALRWLIDKCVFVCFDRDEVVFEDGEVIDHLEIILTGSYLIRKEKDGRSKEMGVWEAPYVAGILPFSRMKETSAEGIALENIQALRLHKDHFTEMINVSYELTQAFVGVMTDRVRDFQNMRLMDEKLLALGKMSAGLAHELNNPASAIVRSSRELHRHLSQTPERFKQQVTANVTPESVDRINKILFDRIKHCSDTSELTLLEREERMDDLDDWFAEQGIDNSEEIIDTFVDWDFSPEHLGRIADIIHTSALPLMLWWIETILTTESLVTEIQTASTRIAELIGSIKSYSHMDSQPSMEFKDVHDGIKSTLTMLKFKFKKSNIRLEKQLTPNLPNIKVLEGELNQVWTNLIVNALDAVPEDGTGRITIRTYQKRENLCVEIADNGSGIPEEIQGRVFEPFFTTKGIGEGTGMGLDIVHRSLKRHGGTVSVESEPGNTCFKVCFPL